MPDQEPVRFYFDPVCPWTWITYCWLREVADARGFSVELRSFSLMHLAKLDGNEMPEQYRERMIAGRDALRVFECLRKNGMGAQSHEFYEDLGARWHVRDEPRSQETILAAATALGASDEVAAACDNQEIDALLDASVHHARVISGPDTGSPVIVTPNGRGFFGPVVSPAPTGADALKLWDAYCALTEIDGVWEIKRGRTDPPVIPVT
ncbi:MAG: DsbA family protein [Acidimicrobiia bacterium]